MGRTPAGDGMPRAGRKTYALALSPSRHRRDHNRPGSSRTRSRSRAPHSSPGFPAVRPVLRSPIPVAIFQRLCALFSGNRPELRVDRELKSVDPVVDRPSGRSAGRLARSGHAGSSSAERGYRKPMVDMMKTSRRWPGPRMGRNPGRWMKNTAHAADHAGCSSAWRLHSCVLKSRRSPARPGGRSVPQSAAVDGRIQFHGLAQRPQVGRTARASPSWVLPGQQPRQVSAHPRQRAWYRPSGPRTPARVRAWRAWTLVGLAGVARLFALHRADRRPGWRSCGLRHG